MVFAVLCYALRLVPRCRACLAPQRVVYFFPKRCRVRCNRRLSTQARRRTFPTAHHVADHIQPHRLTQYGLQCCQPTVRGRAATQAFSFRYLVSPCRRSDVPQPQHTKARRRPHTQPHKPAHSHTPHAACHFALASPRPPTRRGSWRASRISSFFGCRGLKIRLSDSFMFPLCSLYVTMCNL